MTTTDYDEPEAFVAAIREHKPLFVAVNRDQALAAALTSALYADRSGNIHAMAYQSEERLGGPDRRDVTLLEGDADRVCDLVIEAVTSVAGVADFQPFVDDTPNLLVHLLERSHDGYTLLGRAVDYFTPEKLTCARKPKNGGRVYLEKGSYRLVVDLPFFDESRLQTFFPRVQRVDFETLKALLP